MARRRKSWTLSAPTQVIFLISLALAIISLIAVLAFIPNISPHAYWIALIGYVVLAIGCNYKNV